MSPTPAPAVVPDPSRWRALWVCLAVGFMTMLDVSIVNVALPSIERVLDAGPSQLQVVVAGYTLAFGLVLVPAGRLGDMGGRRTLFVLGLVGFALTSLAAGLAPSDEALAVARLLQGASAGLLNPQVIGLIQELFTGFERGKAFGYFGATIGVSTAIGPLVGGLIIAAVGAEHGWRWVFWINVPIALVVLPMAWRLLPRAVPPDPDRARLPLDVVGLGLIALATAAVMVPFVTTTGSDDDPRRWWWLALSAGAGLAAAAWERRYQRRTGAAVLDPALLGSPGFRGGALLGLTYFAGFTSIFLVVTLYLQGGLGYSALLAGLVGMPFAIASAVSAQQSGRLVAAHGRGVVVVGLGLVVVGLIGTEAAIRTLGAERVGWALAVTLLVAGAGSGLVISPNQTLTLARVPVARAGVAGSMLQVGQRIGSAIGIAVALAIYYATLAGGGSGALAAGRALLLTIALVGVAVVVALADARARRDGAPPGTPGEAAA